MSKKKIAFDVAVPVPQDMVKYLIKELEENMQDEYGVKLKMKDNPDVLKIIQEAIKVSLLDAIEDYYNINENIFYSGKLEKLFKKEIELASAALEEKYEAQREAAYAVSGRLNMHPNDVEKAKKILSEAGLKATS